MQTKAGLLVLLILALAALAPAQTLPRVVLFVGPSYEPNGGLQSASIEVGGAKLVGDSTYLGAVAHLGSKGVTPFQISTKIQFHVARKIETFRGAPIFWTAEVGPEFQANTPPLAPASAVAAEIGTNYGYAVGSGPMVSIRLGKQTSLLLHSEMVAGNLQDLTWRAGIMLSFGSE